MWRNRTGDLVLRNITSCVSPWLALQAAVWRLLIVSVCGESRTRVCFRLQEGALKEITALFIAAGWGSSYLKVKRAVVPVLFCCWRNLSEGRNYHFLSLAIKLLIIWLIIWFMKHQKIVQNVHYHFLKPKGTSWVTSRWHPSKTQRYLVY